jgi:two-component system, chemotaxis family, protein-glutamate methylesterase/glutaminase
MGASAGGIHATEVILAGLPEDFPGSVFIVLHLPQWYSSFEFLSPRAHPNFLIKTFERSSRLPVQPAIDGDAIERGRVYVGVPNSHLVVERGTIRLQSSPKESWHRPSVDALFRSAALAYGRRVVGVILSGMLKMSES